MIFVLLFSKHLVTIFGLFSVSIASSAFINLQLVLYRGGHSLYFFIYLMISLIMNKYFLVSPFTTLFILQMSRLIYMT